MNTKQGGRWRNEAVPLWGQPDRNPFPVSVRMVWYALNDPFDLGKCANLVIMVKPYACARGVIPGVDLWGSPNLQGINLNLHQETKAVLLHWMKLNMPVLPLTTVARRHLPACGERESLQIMALFIVIHQQSCLGKGLTQILSVPRDRNVTHILGEESIGGRSGEWEIVVMQLISDSCQCDFWQNF